MAKQKNIFDRLHDEAVDINPQNVDKAIADYHKRVGKVEQRIARNEQLARKYAKITRLS